MMSARRGAMLGLKNYFLQHSKDMHVVLEGYQEGMKQQMVSGLTNTAKSLWLSTLYEEQNTSMVVITHNLFQAQKLYDDLEEFIVPLSFINKMSGFKFPD